MATQDTVDLGPPHAPKEDAIKAFNEIEHDLKRQLIHTRHQHDKHEPEYFAAVKDLSDSQLAAFSAENFSEVRVAVAAYGFILFGKVRIPAMPDDGPAYIHFRAFTGGPDDEAKLHSIHTEEKEDDSGGKSFRAIFKGDESLEWFDS
ncbi:hypothetical protein B0T18DRAFT_312381 [Schizothecium vesticola]|uniref:Uncharacterized protein n=1 Tax=Schizothecium vesticola TaxID=314040 RepID=A0AA40KCD5_9PEZI|nr:hypothetical protein B0T18DRAFT_312381 [Schizothecium vesticola]